MRSAPTTMVRNFSSLNGLPARPIRVWRYRAGPGESRRIHRAMPAMTGASRTASGTATARSAARFARPPTGTSGNGVYAVQPLPRRRSREERLHRGDEPRGQDGAVVVLAGVRLPALAHRARGRPGRRPAGARRRPGPPRPRAGPRCRSRPPRPAGSARRAARTPRSGARRRGSRRPCSAARRRTARGPGTAAGRRRRAPARRAPRASAPGRRRSRCPARAGRRRPPGRPSGRPSPPAPGAAPGSSRSRSPASSTVSSEL